MKILKTGLHYPRNVKFFIYRLFDFHQNLWEGCLWDVPHDANEKYEKEVRPPKNVKLQFFNTRGLKFLFTNQTPYDGSPWDVPHFDSQTPRKRVKQLRKVEILEKLRF